MRRIRVQNIDPIKKLRHYGIITLTPPVLQLERQRLIRVVQSQAGRVIVGEPQQIKIHLAVGKGNI